MLKPPATQPFIACFRDYYTTDCPKVSVFKNLKVVEDKKLL